MVETKITKSWALEGLVDQLLLFQANEVLVGSIVLVEKVSAYPSAHVRLQLALAYLFETIFDKANFGIGFHLPLLPLLNLPFNLIPFIVL